MRDERVRADQFLALDASEAVVVPQLRLVTELLLTSNNKVRIPLDRPDQGRSGKFLFGGTVSET